MSTLLAAIASDLIGFAGLQGNVAGHALDKLFSNRILRAQQILVDEVSQGRRPSADLSDEDAAAIAFRYLRAAQEGAARLNLRLLAQIIAGTVHTMVLTADEFLYYAKLLEDLRSDELHFLGTLQKHWSRKDLPLGDPGNDETFRKASAAMAATRQELVPAVFQTNLELDTVAVALMRTGLLVQHPTMDGINHYQPSPLFDRLLRMVDLGAAFQKEAL